MRHTTIVAFSAVMLGGLAGAQSTDDFGNCTQFNWDQQPVYIIKDSPQTVSGATSCPSSARNGTCYVTAKGDAQFTWSRNVTHLSTFIPGTGTDLLVDSINAAVSPELSSTSLSPTFNDTVIAPVDQTRVLAPGQAAYLNFTAYQVCFTGTLANCTGSVEEGTPIEACAPLWSQTGSRSVEVDGEYTFVNISADEVDQHTDPFRGQTNDGGGDSAASASGVVNHALLGLGVVAAILAAQ
ncbi:hypothetical protein E0Z10_g10638 [Xylaria hypoxylon]|uniref:Ig-like domain-containing protein n=1 Tax=Xylaria hypoxylon TaxID=37992 RepID=A0A4Z0YKG1_9PEZI|nr:hypothetical protein E0Z10_g10638 [Xylaria hypoxylon]